jgi:hypothetical protein
MGNGADNELDVQIVVDGDHITVTLPGTTFCVVYRKASDGPSLVASDIRDDHNSPISRWTFRARAWAAAKEKGQELGWIV